MLTCYIIDDDKFSIASMKDYIQKTPSLEIIGSNTNPILAIEEIRKSRKPDIVFLDVEMPELSGIDVANLLPTSIAVVFTTSHSRYALKAFEVDAMDFLLKPFSFEVFLKSVHKVRSKIQVAAHNHQEPRFHQIFINPGVKGKMVQIELAEVTHIEAFEHSICIHLLTGKVNTNLSIKKIQEKLPESKFTRVHRTFIVNISLIKSIDGNQITLKNDSVIPFGDAFRDLLMSKIQSTTFKS